MKGIKKKEQPWEKELPTENSSPAKFLQLALMPPPRELGSLVFLSKNETKSKLLGGPLITIINGSLFWHFMDLSAVRQLSA